MRLSESQQQVILRAVAHWFGSDARVYLFGSRVDDTRRGGDIDLLVEAECPGDEEFMRRMRTIAEIQLAIGEQKIDLVVTASILDDERLVVREAASHGVPL